MSEEKKELRFPIMDGPSIPWSLIAPHEHQAIKNHDQSLKRLAERGGLSCCEAVAVLEDRKLEYPINKEARARLIEILETDSKTVITSLRAQVERLTNERDAFEKDARHQTHLKIIAQEVQDKLSRSIPLAEERDTLKHRLEECEKALKEIAEGFGWQGHMAFEALGIDSKWMTAEAARKALEGKI